MKVLGLAVVAAAICTMPQHARAEAAQKEEGFELCNRTRFNVVFAKALNVKDANKKDVITSEGWFQVAAGSCEMLYPGKLKYRYYMIYAEAKGSNRKWTGKVSVCVDNRDFKLTGPACPANKNRRMFIEVDTGDYDTYTYDLN